MADTATFTTIYQQRVDLVAAALKDNSKLSGKQAAELAVHALHALDHLPEKVR